MVGAEMCDEASQTTGIKYRCEDATRYLKTDERKLRFDRLRLAGNITEYGKIDR